MTPPPPVSLAVVGAAHLNADGSNRQFEILLCEPGDPIQLVPEPKNKFDEHAVGVFTGAGAQIGYLSAERAPWIGARMNDCDVIAVFQRQADFGAWIRVTFDGTPPALTPAMLIAKDDDEEPAWGDQADEPDFYPDEIWDED